MARRISLLALCLLAGCGGGSNPKSSSTATPVSSGPAAPRGPGAAPAAVTATLTAVFEHPTAGQCATAMTSRYQRQAFGTDAANGHTSVAKACSEHQKARAATAPGLRAVTVEGLSVSGASASATVRGGSGYPLHVLLVKDRGAWKLDGIGPAQAPPGSGKLVAPSGSLYAYRIPPGLVAAGTRIGSVATTGAGFSTGVAPPGGRPGDGIVVAQTVVGLPVRDVAAARAQLSERDKRFRRTSRAATISQPSVTEVSGRAAITWKLTGDPAASGADGRTTYVFSTAQPVVVVNCRWSRGSPQQALVSRGCDALLGSLRVG